MSPPLAPAQANIYIGRGPERTVTLHLSVPCTIADIWVGLADRLGARAGDLANEYQLFQHGVPLRASARVGRPRPY